MNIPAPPKWCWTYNSFLLCGRGQIFAMGRLNVPLGVLTVTTRILPFAPGWTSLMTAVGQWSGGVLSSLRITGSPGWMLWDERCQRWRCCSSKVVGRPPIPVVLELLLMTFATWTIYSFDVRVVNGG